MARRRLTAKELILRAVPEKEFQTEIVLQAEAWGWHVHYVTNSKQSKEGWPDLFMVRGERIVVFENKTMLGEVTPDQRVWLVDLWATGKVEPFVMRPNCWELIAKVLAPAGVSVR